MADAGGTWERGDLRWGTIPEVVADAGRRLGDAPAIEDGDVTLTYAELAARVDEVARALLGSGLERGDRVGLWAPNLWEWIVAAVGVQRAGGVLVPLNTRFKGHEAGYVLGKSRARLLFTVNGFLGTDYVALLREAMGGPEDGRPVAGLPDLERIVVLRGDAPEATEALDVLLERAGSVGAEASAARAAELGPDDLADLLFTSGTTGAPKGVMAAHGQTLRAFRDWAGLCGLAEGDRYLVVNPFFHSFGYKAGWLAAVMCGATVVPHAVFDAGEVMDRIERDRISVLPGPPTLYQTILGHPDRSRRDLSSLRLAVTGAASIPVELVLRMRDTLGFDTVLTAYGLTESCGIATMCRLDDDAETIASTSGRAIPDLEVRCVDDDGAAVPADEPGEVVVRGYTVMQGYFEDPEETARAIDGDGWLHTGDIGTMDADGYLKITDRKKDMFIVGGFNAYPAEIENLMLADERFTQVAVVGVPDERLGEVGLAFVVLAAGATADPDEVIAWCRERMANYKVPRHVVFVDAMPLNATGKVLKYELREQAAALVQGQG